MFTTSNGRVLTPPKELKPLLKGAYPAFYKFLGHIRFFYVADELWDGKASLVFRQLAALSLEDGAFHVRIGDESFQVMDESQLEAIYNELKKAATPSQCRPADQLAVDLDEYPNGIRCDLCLLFKGQNENNDFAGNRKFPVMDRNCYYGVQEGWGEHDLNLTEVSTWTCEGMDGCYTKTLACLKKKKKKGVNNCLECGKYRTCGKCGVGHNPGECNLGITAEEVTNLIIPYCEVERLDLLRDAGL